MGSSLKMNIYTKIFKRIIDIALSVILLFLTFPVIFIFGALIFISDGASPIYTQRRIGKDGKEFYIYKLRSMRKEAPEVATHLLGEDSEQITSIGRFIRRTSIDELPQLMNVIKGEMSLVGPRPALWNQYDLIDLRKEQGIDKLTPGITGWAQVNGRDSISLECKVALDREYLSSVNAGSLSAFLMDAKCILRTFEAIITHK